MYQKSAFCGFPLLYFVLKDIILNIRSHHRKFTLQIINLSHIPIYTIQYINLYYVIYLITYFIHVNNKFNI